MRRSLLLLFALALSACSASANLAGGPDLVDDRATPETRALFVNLQRIAPDHLLFGHQDALAYGVDWVREAGRSDVRDVAGDYPAVYGWELGDLELGADQNLDGVDFDDMQGWIREGHARGGVITLAWHMAHPATGGNTWDRTPGGVATVLPGAENHAQFLSWLDTFARFVDGLRDVDGRPIPVLFRPYHEHTGSWFWWGAEQTTVADYQALWRMTVEYLRDEKGLHNLLYVYSPDVFETEAEYLERYPGDAYVDVLGSDDYQALKTDSTVSDMTRRLGMVVRMAEARGKLAVLSETGLEGVPDDDWWTNRLLRAIEADPDARRVAYALVWRNATAAVREAQGESTTHWFGPHPGGADADDFRRFAETDFVLLEGDLPDLYTR
ncbi:beta-mannosidase [Rubrivirga sp. SAORIC476]|uniref:glycoside hydrolase family 26 protein n=1 Tax=Rubrivirga sp. SAORIC476 TaxID=1961794 RepID=UPI000BA9B84F|nr:glycosyl hydrolase [Rubrivirga sp. SAORIC476]PAP80865.1 beta-mannosidase [Rubrivirga sp. SAORIC476]